MKEIPLTQGLVTQVDDEDYNWLNQWKWCALKSKNTYYAVRNSETINGKRYNIYMHRVIMKTPKHLQCDHQDQNGLNNQKFNLRHASNTQNQINVTHFNTSGYRGVTYNKQHEKWRVQITINHKRKHLGYFDNAIKAAERYDRAALKYHGEFAIINFK